jgi:hypothetical protein
VSNFSYVFGDILTGQVIAEIPLFGVSMTRGLGMGEFRGSFQLDQTGKTNRDLIEATQEGRCYVVCEKEGQVIWGGFIKTRTYQSQAKSMQLFALSWEHYPEYRLMREDEVTYTDTEQTSIFIDLWNTMMDDTNSIQFSMPSSLTTVSKSLTAKVFEFKYYRELFNQLADADDGFDWTIDVQRVSGVYAKSLRIGYPTLGATIATDFDYPGSIINYWQNGSMANRATHFYGIGAGEGSAMLTQEVIHTDLVSSGFPRYDLTVGGLKGITDETILAGLITQRAIVKKPGVPILTVELKGDKTPVFGSYGLGDAARLNLMDPMHPEPVEQIINTRILGWEYYPPQDSHTEMARLVFEGDE